jgi:hypothetical protein
MDELWEANVYFSPRSTHQTRVRAAEIMD